MRGNTLSVDEARRIALAAQGFDRSRPDTSCDARHIRRVIQRLGLLQLDFVNVLIPAHYLIVYSRLGPYARERFDRLVYGSGEFTEQWAHEASIVPVDCWPLLEHRRRAFRPWPNSPIMKLRNRDKYLEQTLKLVQRDGPLTSQDLPPVPGPARKAGDWHRSIPRSALEYHFGSGRLAVADRLRNFQRVYDLPGRLIGKPHYKRKISDAEAQRTLLKRAADSYGIATLHDLADYYRMSPRDARPRVAELVEEGSLVPMEVDGWTEAAYMSPGAKLPKSITSTTLLSPFDPLVWYRNRAERLFDFHYRIEIYVPEKKRRWGYYVLPFLLDDRLVARVDLKADRNNSTLLVQAAHPEDGIDTDRVVDELRSELQTLSAWLKLDRIKCRRRGAFARLLADRCRAIQ
jgi:uncharacterized protein YcaQ